MKWELYSVSDFDLFKTQWEALNSKHLKSSLFDIRCVLPLLKYFASNKEVIAVLTHDDSVQGIVVLEKLGRGQWQTFQPSQSPLGFNLINPEYFNEKTIALLTSALPGLVTSIGFTQLDPQHYKRPEESTHCRTLDYITTGKLSVPEDFDGYWSERSRNVKQNYNRARNRLAKQDISIEFKVLTKKDDVIEGVGIYGDIESSSWKAESGTAVSRENVQGQFYRDLISGFAPDNVEVWQYLYNDEVVATDLCIKNSREMIILKTTFVDEWNKYSPAFSMHIDGIQHLVDSSIDTIEFYGPAMDWHKKLTGDLRTMYHLTWYSYPVLLNVKSAINKLKDNRFINRKKNSDIAVKKEASVGE